MIIYRFKVGGMTCSSCVYTLQSGISSLACVQKVFVCLLTEKITIWSDDSEYDPKSVAFLSEEIEDLGFDANEMAVSEGKDDSLTLKITGMTCASCVSTIENHLKSIQGVVDVSINLLTEKASIVLDPAVVKARELIEEVESIGFEAALDEEVADSANNRLDGRNKAIKSFLHCLVFGLPVLVLGMIFPYFMPDEFFTEGTLVNGISSFLFVVFALASVVQFWFGKKFYKGAYTALSHKSANMDVLVALGTSAAFFYGVVLMILGHDPDSSRYLTNIKTNAHLLETASTLITIIFFGKTLETYTKSKTLDALHGLASLQISSAILFTPADPNSFEQGTEEEVSVKLLTVGDFVKLSAGVTTPVDGIIVHGKARMNEEMLTGESEPVQKKQGDKVFGGTVCVTGSIVVQVESTGDDTALAKIISMVENAQASKAPIQEVADRISHYFVPVVVVIAILTWIFWFSMAYSGTDAEDTIEDSSHGNKILFCFKFGVAVLVIACPCALGLALPTAVMVGSGIAAKNGILIKGADVLEAVSKITDVMFDKTGTLTSGCPQVSDYISVHTERQNLDDDLVNTLVYMSEEQSEHPLAKAVVKKFKDEVHQEIASRLTVKDFEVVSGEGLRAVFTDEETHESYEVAIGNLRLMSKVLVTYDTEVPQEIAAHISELEEEAKTVVTVSVNGQICRIMALAEPHLVKPESKAVIDHLKARNINVWMITGDNAKCANRIANTLGIAPENVFSQVYPNNKQEKVKEVQAKGGKVMMVGDGMNDSPSLAQADVGIAINAASDLVTESADIVIMMNNLWDVICAIDISRTIFKRIKFNFFWAMIYNLVGIPIAAGVFFFYPGIHMDPKLAGLAMAMSSVSVITSSLLLKLYKKPQQPEPEQIINPQGEAIISMPTHIELAQTERDVHELASALFALRMDDDEALEIEEPRRG
mmetsp:Transcript_44542/g.51286  ORF Transcript_44542/g.51286 Transcript_44542/m.51286 type:complete len:936 (+) Transcript_44542:281-3088(+)